MLYELCEIIVLCEFLNRLFYGNRINAQNFEL